MYCDSHVRARSWRKGSRCRRVRNILGSMMMHVVACAGFPNSFRATTPILVSDPIDECVILETIQTTLKKSNKMLVVTPTTGKKTSQKMLLLLVLCLLNIVATYDNGVGKLPVMGWNSWFDISSRLIFPRNQFGCSVSEELILQTMAGLKKYNLDKAGFTYINLDDCWQLPYRDKDGHVIPDPKLFPHGIKYLADQVHDQGLKLGLYTDIGVHTCQKRAGSYGFYKEDAETYAEWGIDYVKVDFCYTTGDEAEHPWIYYGNFSAEINATGRHIVFSICNWGVKDPWKWAPQIANSWRTTGDISPKYSSVLSNMEITRSLDSYSGLYNYNDPDMLEVGVVRGSEKLSQNENRAHYSLWCMMSAPLLLGNDLRDIDPDVLAIITNPEVNAVSQDSTGKQGVLVKEDTHGLVDHKCTLKAPSFCKWVQIWKKELEGEKIAVLLFNHGDSDEVSSLFESETITVTWSELGVDPGKEFDVRDLWGKKDLGSAKGLFVYPQPVVQHSVAMIVLSPK